MTDTTEHRERVGALILGEDEATLIALVMRLTGGSANPEVVRAQIARIRKEVTS